MFTVDGGHNIASGPSRKPSIDFLILEKSARLLNEQLIRDSRLLPDLKDILAGGASTPASYLPQPETPWELYHQKRIVPIPEALFNHFQTTSSQTFLGLFPELDRAWVTVDEKLFIWDYIHGEFDTFAEQPDTITGVTLVNPKPGVFVDDIKHVMVVCTTSSIILIGVGLSFEPATGESIRKILKLYATDMVLSTKNIGMSCIVGTDTGRIFMVGSDGNLYELDYASAESWFSAKTYLRNHTLSLVSSLLPSFMNATSEAKITHILVDNFRHCLYTVYTPQSISVFYLGADGMASHLTAAATLRDIPKQIRHLAPGGLNLDLKNFEITGFHVVTPSEAPSDVHAVVITSKGVRLYLSNKKSSSYNYGYPSYGALSSDGQPTDLRIIHVRVPPTNMIDPNSGAPSVQYSMNNKQPVSEAKLFQITQVTDTFYSDGLFIVSQPPPPGQDGSGSILLCNFPDTPAMAGLKQTPQTQTMFSQHPSSYNRPALTETIKLIPIPGESWAIAESPRPRPPRSTSSVAFNELVSQFSEIQRELTVLSHVGVTHLVKLRPVDVLYRLIQQDNRYELELFCKSYGRDQTCGMLFGILAQNSYILHDPAEHGHTFRPSARIDVGMNTRQVLFAIAGKPMINPSSIVEHSGRLHGLAIYISRITSPFWQVKVTKQSSPGRLSLGPNEDILVRARHNLHSLHELCERDPFLFQAPPAEHRSGQQDEAWTSELTTASQLIGLVAQIIEALSFVLLLHDFNLEDLVARCEKTSQQNLASITFADLITTQGGRDLGRNLVNAVINQQIDQQVNVDTVSEVLHQRCGSFCSTDDVLLYKAEESVRKATESRNRTERMQALSESLKLYSKGCKNIPLTKLEEVVLEYRQLHYPKGAVELPLRCAQEWDVDNSGYEHWLAGSPANDPRIEAYNLRNSCYELILGALDFFDQLAVLDRDAPNRSIPEDAQLISESAFRTALNSTDAAFHSALYEWLIGRGSADELLEIETPFLESHLQREPLTLRNGELLWQYYVKNGFYIRAAETLQGLAESSRFTLKLDQRIEFLSLAIGTAKSHPVSELGRQETAVAFLTELEEKLEVAQAQLQILETIQQEADSTEIYTQQKIHELSTGLKTVTELYEDYADPLNLPEMKLLLLHVSEHQDTHLVISIWRYLFDRLATAESLEDEFSALSNLIERLGRKYYPSESAFPIEYITKTLQDKSVKERAHVPPGWAARVLHRARVPYQVIFDQLHTLYESQLPPYHISVNIQALSTDIAILLRDWLDDATSSRSSRADFPVVLISRVVDSLLKETTPSNTETRKVYEEITFRLQKEL